MDINGEQLLCRFFCNKFGKHLSHGDDTISGPAPITAGNMQERGYSRQEEAAVVAFVDTVLTYARSYPDNTPSGLHFIAQVAEEWQQHQPGSSFNIARPLDAYQALFSKAYTSPPSTRRQQIDSIAERIAVEGGASWANLRSVKQLYQATVKSAPAGLAPRKSLWSQHSLLVAWVDNLGGLVEYDAASFQPPARVSLPAVKGRLTAGYIALQKLIEKFPKHVEAAQLERPPNFPTQTAHELLLAPLESPSASFEEALRELAAAAIWAPSGDQDLYEDLESFYAILAATGHNKYQADLRYKGLIKEIISQGESDPGPIAYYSTRPHRGHLRAAVVFAQLKERLLTMSANPPNVVFWELNGQYTRPLAPGYPYIEYTRRH